MPDKTIRIVSRGSMLALTQTRMVAGMLEHANPGVAFPVATLKTLGDAVTNKPLSSFGGVGVFVKELEQALMDGSADLAVHSLKDVPAAQPQGLRLVCFPQRVDPSDVLLTRDGTTLDTLPHGAKVGTGSPRRIVQLKARRPDLHFADLRGNLDTRVAKLKAGEYDAVVLAAAGMTRIGIHYDQACVLPHDVCLPAPGQGALALEAREGDETAAKAVAAVNDAGVQMQVEAERAFLRVVNAGCAAPVAALARSDGNGMVLDAMVGDPQSGKIVRLTVHFAAADCAAAAADLGRRILDAGRRLGVLP